MGAHHSDEWYIAVAMAIIAAMWETGWVVLSLAGSEPRGQLPQAFGRVMAAVHLAVANHPIAAGWPHVLWDPGRVVTPLAVVLAVAGLVLVGTVVVRAAHRLLDLRAGRAGMGWPRSGSGAAGKRQEQAGPTVDKSLDEWLASVAAGEEE
jgi:hypothetical protein